MSGPGIDDEGSSDATDATDAGATVPERGSVTVRLLGISKPGTKSQEEKEQMKRGKERGPDRPQQPIQAFHVPAVRAP